jgi:hypothetical protein
MPVVQIIRTRITRRFRLTVQPFRPPLVITRDRLRFVIDFLAEIGDACFGCKTGTGSGIGGNGVRHYFLTFLIVALDFLRDLGVTLHS